MVHIKDKRYSVGWQELLSDERKFRVMARIIKELSVPSCPLSGGPSQREQKSSEA
jgi:hypothetical protein